MSPETPPVPPDDPENESQMTNSSTGVSVSVEDKRAEFERISRQQPRDEDAERAFIESKIEIIRTDPNLTDEEKERAIKEIRSLEKKRAKGQSSH